MTENTGNKWRTWVRPLILTSYIIVVIILVPICIWQLAQGGKLELHREAWFVGGVFTILTVPISLWGILQHLLNYNQPILQKHIIR